MESFKVFNPHNLNVSFNVAPSHDFDAFEGMAKHKVRRIIRGSVMPICVRAKQSLDLVEETKLTVEELKANSELNSMLRMGSLVHLKDEVEEPVKIDVVEVEPEIESEPTVEVKEVETEGFVKVEVNVTEPVTEDTIITTDLGVVEDKVEVPSIVIPEAFVEKEKEKPAKKKRGRKKATKKA